MVCKNMLSPDDSLLLVVDIQDAFTEHIHEMDRVIRRSALMIQAAGLLELPVVITEQYPKGLGRTVEAIQAVVGPLTCYDKVSFCCLQNDAIRDAILNASRSQILMVGIETHVCIAQTAFNALATGLQPFVAADAVGSRRPFDHDIALDRMRQAGVKVTTTEAAIMEMTVSSKHPAFKDLSRLIKDKQL